MPRIDVPQMFNLLNNDRPDCIGGQFPFGVHFGRCLSGQYYFFLRDPIERVLSHYRFIQGYPAHPLWKLAMSLPAGKFTEECGAADFNDGQTRYLAERLDYALKPIDKYIDDGDLALAVNNLKLSVFGLVEDLEKSVQLIAHNLNCDPPSPLVYHKPSNHKANCQEDQLMILEDWNSHDLSLYAAAQKIYRERLEVFKHG
jgi:hypothetical protein